MKAITWTSKKVLTGSIDPTPTNYKIKSDLGRERLRQSLKAFGLAGNAVCNHSGKKGRYDLIDGNSRLEQAKERKEKWMWISVPSRKLTTKEFKEMSAMFDFAKAGEVDVERIEQDLGTSKDFFNRWGMLIPTRVLDTIGKTAQVTAADFKPEKEKEKEQRDKKSVILREKFIEPPFSVLDSKNGNWQERKRQWFDLGIQSELGRSEGLVYNIGDMKRDDGSLWAPKKSKLRVKAKTLTQSIPLKSYGNMDEYHSKEGQASNTSIFDPALCELMYYWFCPKKGSVLDPFAGGSVRGIVAHYLGFKYWGIDLSRKQIEANRKQGIDILKKNNQPIWLSGDSDMVLSKKWETKFDFIMSCPPYVDLEVYSKDPNDISNMKYPDFLKKYKSIIIKSLKLLKPKRYACFVVSEVRDKKGYYYDFVGDTKRIFIEAGAYLYNDAVLLNMVGSASMRADRQFSASKKLVRTHQNVLIFYKP